MTDAGRHLAALRRREVLTCSVCGKVFEGYRREGQRYCSNACRQRARYQRRKARGETAAMAVEYIKVSINPGSLGLDGLAQQYDPDESSARYAAFLENTLRDRFRGAEISVRVVREPVLDSIHVDASTPEEERRARELIRSLEERVLAGQFGDWAVPVGDGSSSTAHQ